MCYKLIYLMFSVNDLSPHPPPPQPPPDLMFAPDGEGVADDGPLGLPEEGHDLAQVVDQADQVKPVLLGVVRPNIT